MVMQRYQRRLRAGFGRRARASAPPLLLCLALLVACGGADATVDKRLSEASPTPISVAATTGVATATAGGARGTTASGGATVASATAPPGTALPLATPTTVRTPTLVRTPTIIVARTPTLTRTPATAAARTPSGTSAASPGGAGRALAPLVGGQAYSDSQGRFSLLVPPEWIRISDRPDVDAAFTAGDDATVAGVKLGAAPGLTAERYDELVEGQLRGLAGYTPISVERVTIGGRPAYRRVFRATVQGLGLQLMRVTIVADDTAHVLTFSTRADFFARFEATFDGIAGSYRP